MYLQYLCFMDMYIFQFPWIDSFTHWLLHFFIDMNASKKKASRKNSPRKDTAARSAAPCLTSQHQCLLDVKEMDGMKGTQGMKGMSDRNDTKDMKDMNDPSHMNDLKMNESSNYSYIIITLVVIVLGQWPLIIRCGFPRLAEICQGRSFFDPLDHTIITK